MNIPKRLKNISEIYLVSSNVIPQGKFLETHHNIETSIMGMEGYILVKIFFSLFI